MNANCCKLKYVATLNASTSYRISIKALCEDSKTWDGINYALLTTDNFLVDYDGTSRIIGNGGTSGPFAGSCTYVPSTGILTVNLIGGYYNNTAIYTAKVYVIIGMTKSDSMK
jgi:hypothetical protein